ncbi:hypothetical protein [Streptomyces sp. NPDC052811]|uniref:hypothetical protein n=1 Tax=Streptomyces sp. NPDC052811 TaxID=3155731 RepID=UPI00341F03EB
MHRPTFRFASVPRPRPAAPPQPSARSAPRPEPVWDASLPVRERDRLNAAAVEAARVLHNVVAHLRHTDGNRRWALGTPLYVVDRPYGVLRPRPSFVNWSHVKGLVIFVRNNDELRLLGRTAPNGTRIIVLPEDGGT